MLTGVPGLGSPWVGPSVCLRQGLVGNRPGLPSRLGEGSRYLETGILRLGRRRQLLDLGGVTSEALPFLWLSRHMAGVVLLRGEARVVLRLVPLRHLVLTGSHVAVMAHVTGMSRSLGESRCISESGGARRLDAV